MRRLWMVIRSTKRGVWFWYRPRNSGVRSRSVIFNDAMSSTHFPLASLGSSRDAPRFLLVDVGVPRHKGAFSLRRTTGTETIIEQSQERVNLLPFFGKVFRTSHAGEQRSPPRRLSR